MMSSEGNGAEALTLEGLLADSAVELDLLGAGKKETIERLLDRLEQAGAVLDWQQALGDLYSREQQGSTALGRGVAFPHAKTSGAQEPALAFGRCPAGLDFEALDGEPVFLVFLLIVPRWRAGLHLRVLAALNRFLRNEENRRRLLAASDEATVRELLRGVPIR